MSLHGLVTGIPQTERAILTDTSATVLLTASENGNFVHSIYVAETSGNATTVIIDMYDGATAYKLTGTRSIAANDDLWLLVDQHIERGWTVRATASAGNRLHTHVTHSLPT